MSGVDNSVTQSIEGLRAGEETAATELWQRYFQRLVGLACKKLGSAPRRVADEEDVALSAFQSFCQGVRDNRFPKLHDRDDLWHLIVRITERKACDQLRGQARKKRGSGLVAGESALRNGRATGGGAGIDGLAGPEPTPEFAAEMIEAVDQLFNVLDDRELRRIALMKLEACSNEEIAAEIGRSLPTVERRLKMIRKIWKTKFAGEARK
jgi:DNA-directed RNA polymerase specialized sigma24 family protein